MKMEVRWLLAYSLIQAEFSECLLGGVQGGLGNGPSQGPEPHPAPRDGLWNKLLKVSGFRLNTLSALFDSLHHGVNI